MAAINDGDRDAFLATFTPDATLADDGNLRSLRDWIDREIFDHQWSWIGDTGAVPYDPTIYHAHLPRTDCPLTNPPVCSTGLTERGRLPGPCWPARGWLGAGLLRLPGMGALGQAGGPSRTAVLTAVAWAIHRQEPRPWVIDDFLALGLAGQEGMALAERLRAELPRPYLRAFSRWVCVRARFAEDVVERAAASGVGQYVILGAAELLHQHGFGELTDFGPEQASAAYFQGSHRHRHRRGPAADCRHSHAGSST